MQVSISPVNPAGECTLGAGRVGATGIESLDDLEFWWDAIPTPANARIAKDRKNTASKWFLILVVVILKFLE